MVDPPAHLNTYGVICSINDLSLSLWECIILPIVWCTALTVWGPSDCRLHTYWYVLLHMPCPSPPYPILSPKLLADQPIHQIEFVTPRSHSFTKQLRNISFWVIYYIFAMVACKMQLITKCYMLHARPLPADTAPPLTQHIYSLTAPPIHQKAL